MPTQRWISTRAIRAVKYGCTPQDIHAVQPLRNRDLEQGAFTYVPPARHELSRAMEIDRRYSDVGLGLVLKEKENVNREVGNSRGENLR